MAKSLRIFLLACACVLYADPPQTFLEAKGAYYWPQSDLFRSVYGSTGMAGIEGTCEIWDCVYGWASSGFVYKTGTSVGQAGGSDTRFYMIPLGAGIKLVSPGTLANFYVGGGILPAYINVDDDSSFVVRSSSKWAVGGIVKAGVFLNATKHLFFDVFSDYGFLKTKFSTPRNPVIVRNEMNLNHWLLGLGIGYRFFAKEQEKKGEKR
jgi:hypothetical protein